MYNVKVYSMKDESGRRITGHFRVREFACADSSDPVFVSDTLVGILESIRQHFGKPVHVNSGYRTVSYNSTLPNSSKRSQHMLGLAADIRVDGHTPKEVYDFACSLLGDHGGVGIYNTFVHIDVRSVKSRFDCRT